MNRCKCQPPSFTSVVECLLKMSSMQNGSTRNNQWSSRCPQFWIDCSNGSCQLLGRFFQNSDRHNITASCCLLDQMSQGCYCRARRLSPVDTLNKLRWSA